MRRLFIALVCFAGAFVTNPARADVLLPALSQTLAPKTTPTDESGDPDDDTADIDTADEGLSKKSAFLAEKLARKDVHAPAAAAAPIGPQKIVVLRNAKTQESIEVPLDPRALNAAEQETFSHFLRCRFTNTAADMDKRLLSTLVQVARKFKTSLIEIVSGYRSPKFQLMLRKKGHEVARDSEHTRGNAVDFRLPAVKTRKLLAYVKSLRMGGVGYYPQSGFVHADVGRVRYWRGH